MEATQSNYEWLLKKISNGHILALPNFKIIIDVIESNEDEDGKPLYQRHKLVNYSRKKCYLLDHAQYILKKITDSFEQRYSNIFGKDVKRQYLLGRMWPSFWCCLPSELQRLAKFRGNRRRKLWSTGQIASKYDFVLWENGNLSIINWRWSRWELLIHCKV